MITLKLHNYTRDEVRDLRERLLEAAGTTHRKTVPRKRVATTAPHVISVKIL